MIHGTFIQFWKPSIRILSVPHHSRAHIFGWVSSQRWTWMLAGDLDASVRANEIRAVVWFSTFDVFSVYWIHFIILNSRGQSETDGCKTLCLSMAQAWITSGRVPRKTDKLDYNLLLIISINTFRLEMPLGYMGPLVVDIDGIYTRARIKLDLFAVGSTSTSHNGTRFECLNRESIVQCT